MTCAAAKAAACPPAQPVQNDVKSVETEVCRNFQMGKCNWGEHCRFSHEERVSLTVEEFRATVAAEVEALMQPARCEDSPEKCAQGPPLTNSDPKPYSNPKSSAPVTSDDSTLKFSEGVFRSVGDGLEWDGYCSTQTGSVGLKIDKLADTVANSESVLNVHLNPLASK